VERGKRPFAWSPGDLCSVGAEQIPFAASQTASAFAKALARQASVRHYPYFSLMVDGLWLIVDGKSGRGLHF